MTASNPRTSFPERLRAVRQGLRGMSQVALAKATGLPAPSIAYFESGTRKPSFDSLGKLATALNVSADYLLGLVDTPNAAASADSLAQYGAQLSARDRSFAEDILRLMVERKRRDRERDK